MAAYTHTTFAKAKNNLAQLLGDPGKVFYTDSELGLYIKEALRFWGLASQYWRQTTYLTTTPGVAFYDVSESLKLADESKPQQFSVTDRELINDINVNLMEPLISNWGSGWLGTEQFSLEQISSLLAYSRDDILRQSACVITYKDYPITPGVSRIVLAESSSDVSTSTIVRATIQEQNSNILPLYAIDYYQAQSTVDTASWPAQGRPKAYTLNNAPLLTMDLWPTPATTATLRVYSQQVGGNIAPTEQATILPLPTDAAWLIKYRLIEDLTNSDGLSKASEISQYAQQRWQHGMEFLSLYNSLIWSEINGKRMTVSSQAQLDSSRVMWENTTGMPKSIQQLSWNLFSLYPVPDSTYTITIDSVIAAPIPTLDSDYVDIGPQYLQVILDYAQHIAMIKVQGSDFAATMPLYENAIKVALEHQANIAATAINFSAQMFQAKADRLMRPVRRPEIIAETQAMIGAQ